MRFPLRRRASTEPQRLDRDDPRAMAAEAAYNAEHGRLFPMAARFAAKHGSSSWADDVAQQALIELWDVCYADGVIPAEPVDALFYRILRRRIIDAQREDEVDQASRGNADHIRDVVGRIENASDTALLADASLARDRIAYHAETLPAQCRRVFQAAAANDWDAHRTADQLAMPVATVRWHLGRAVERIRAGMRDDGYDVPESLPRGRRNVRFS